MSLVTARYEAKSSRVSEGWWVKEGKGRESYLAISVQSPSVPPQATTGSLRNLISPPGFPGSSELGYLARHLCLLSPAHGEASEDSISVNLLCYNIYSSLKHLLRGLCKEVR